MKKLLYEILNDAFGLTTAELSGLPLSTSLMDLYDRFPQGRGDNCEFETLQLEIEREVGRTLSDVELQSTMAIGDVLQLLEDAKGGDKSN